MKPPESIAEDIIEEVFQEWVGPKYDLKVVLTSMIKHSQAEAYSAGIEVCAERLEADAKSPVKRLFSVYARLFRTLKKP
jgi:hypothetical protein